MKRDGITPPLPPNSAPHFIAWFIELGMIQAGGMAPMPLTWTEIDAWTRQTGIRLQPWEARLMKALSLAYLRELALAESENRPPPWQWPITQREIEIENARLDAVLG